MTNNKTTIVATDIGYGISKTLFPLLNKHEGVWDDRGNWIKDDEIKAFLRLKTGKFAIVIKDEVISKHIEEGSRTNHTQFIMPLEIDEEGYIHMSLDRLGGPFSDEYGAFDEDSVNYLNRMHGIVGKHEAFIVSFKIIH